MSTGIVSCGGIVKPCRWDGLIWSVLGFLHFHGFYQGIILSFGSLMYSKGLFHLEKHLVRGLCLVISYEQNPHPVTRQAYDVQYLRIVSNTIWQVNYGATWLPKVVRLLMVHSMSMSLPDISKVSNLNLFPMFLCCVTSHLLNRPNDPVWAVI